MGGYAGLESSLGGDDVAAVHCGFVAGRNQPLDHSTASRDRLHAGQVTNRHDVVEVRQRGGCRTQHPQRLAQHTDEATAQHLDLGREVFTDHRRRWLQLPAGRGVVEQNAHDLGAGDAVDGGVMHLRQHRHRAVLQPVDHIDLPQRARPVQLTADQVSHLRCQLSLIARRWQRELADVVLDVEGAVVNPVRVVEAERDGRQPPAECG